MYRYVLKLIFYQNHKYSKFPLKVKLILQGKHKAVKYHKISLIFNFEVPYYTPASPYLQMAEAFFRASCVKVVFGCLQLSLYLIKLEPSVYPIFWTFNGK